MGNNNREVNCHNCKLDSYEIVSKTKHTTMYVCRLCNAMEVIQLVSATTSVRYKAIRTEIVVDNKW